MRRAAITGMTKMTSTDTMTNKEVENITHLVEFSGGSLLLDNDKVFFVFSDSALKAFVTNVLAINKVEGDVERINIREVA